MKWFSSISGILGLLCCMPALAAPDAPRPARPLVVLDPGHGGSNSGSPGTGDLYEKRFTLALAALVRDRLEERGFDVVLTRERDVYLTLRQRVATANLLGADVFVSLHANASESHGHRGFETFVLTPEALDVDARALRQDDGASRPDVPPRIARLLDDVERGVAHEAAADLAAEIQAQLCEARGPDGDRGVRQESMHVLIGATMPAVLVEVGFLDHPVEGEELRDPAVVAAIADALADAVSKTHGAAE